jgi:hypothetical protein
MASLLSLYGGDAAGGRRRMSRGSGTAPAPVRRLLRRLRSSFIRRSAARPRTRAAARFAYDLRSYSQNFDDGVIASSAPAATARA